MKILIDTDIGDDIDDALALFCAMQQGFEIVGVTTVFQNTCDRARQVKKLLSDFGHGYENVPVYAGFGTPIAQDTAEFPHIPHYTPALENEAYTPNSTDPQDAVDFIIEACRTYGKELTVVAIGPFTNLARVIQKDPTALGQAAKVAIMGGAYLKQYADWNVVCDVESADLMFRSLDNLVCYGADVTHLLEATDALYQQAFGYAGNEPARRYLAQLCRLWRADKPGAPLVLHDPLVIYSLAHPALCEMHRANVAVLTEGYARGITLNIGAYSKMHCNRAAYADFDFDRKISFAAAVDKPAFDEYVLADFSRNG